MCITLGEFIEKFLYLRRTKITMFIQSDNIADNFDLKELEHYYNRRLLDFEIRMEENSMYLEIE